MAFEHREQFGEQPVNNFLPLSLVFSRCQEHSYESSEGTLLMRMKEYENQSLGLQGSWPGQIDSSTLAQ